MVENNTNPEFWTHREQEESREWVEITPIRKGDNDSLRFTETVIIQKVT